MIGDTEMRFKIVFFFIVGFGKYGSFTRLKREYHLKFVPISGLSVKIGKKIHLIEDVVYDFNTDIFNVILEDDNSSGNTYHFSEFTKVKNLYIEDGWEEFILTDYKNVITTPEMHEIITAVNDVKEELKHDAFIEMVSAIMIKSKLTKSLELKELFYFCDLDTCQSISIMERIKELLDLKRE